MKISIIEWKEDSQSLERVADLYEAYWPEYPQKLVESVITLNGVQEGGTILEIGSGTGKATRLFAPRGYTIHCIEPGESMAAVAARTLQAYPHVTIETSRFEEWQEHPESFDLVISAQAFHWVPREIGYAKAARALKFGGP
ncbi:MAG: class I SAM-dependent methyltransferase [Anaerolineales bacterium]